MFIQDDPHNSFADFTVALWEYEVTNRQRT